MFRKTISFTAPAAVCLLLGCVASSDPGGSSPLDKSGECAAGHISAERDDALLHPATRRVAASVDGLVCDVTLAGAGLEEDSPILDAFIEERLIPLFDHTMLGALLLGEHWDGASPDQRARFEAAFSDYLVHLLGTVALGLRDANVSYTEPVPHRSDPSRVTVPSTVHTLYGPVRVDYALYRRGETWTLYDVVVDDLSIIVLQSGQLTTHAARHGFDSLIETLIEMWG